MDHEFEMYVAKRIATCALWDFPLNSLDIIFLVKDI